MSDANPRLPSTHLRSHLAPFAEGPRPWMVLARNAIPVLGVYWLGWSANIIVFQIWFDGVTTLGAMLAFQIQAFAKGGGKPFDVPPDIPSNLLPRVLAFVWLVLWLLLGIPYWFTIVFLSFAVFDGDAWSLPLVNLGVITALVLVLVSNIIEESRRGYDRMSNNEIRLEFNWNFSMHLARVAAILLVTFILRLGLIIALALAISYVEIYPMRTLRFFGGDSTLESGNENRSRD